MASGRSRVEVIAVATLAPGDRAPDFMVRGFDGRTHRLDEGLARGPVVLAFGKSDCSACALAFPYLDRLQQAYPRGRFTVLGILQDGEEEARAFALAHCPGLVVGHEEAPWPVSKAYDPEATPTVFLVDPGGVISRVTTGFSKRDLNETSSAVASLLGLEPVVVASADDGGPSFRPG